MNKRKKYKKYVDGLSKEEANEQLIELLMFFDDLENNNLNVLKEKKNNLDMFNDKNNILYYIPVTLIVKRCMITVIRFPAIERSVLLPAGRAHDGRR